MIYNAQFLGADAAVQASTNKDVSGAVSSVASAVGNIASSFFGYKTAQVQASKTDPNRTAATDDRGGGMSKNTKTALIIGGGAAALILVLVVAMR